MDLWRNIRAGKYNEKLPYGPSNEAKELYKEESRQREVQFREDAAAYAIEKGVPERYVQKLIGLAWEEGHSAGYTEVLIHLENLIGIFK